MKTATRSIALDRRCRTRLVKHKAKEYEPEDWDLFDIRIVVLPLSGG